MENGLYPVPAGKVAMAVTHLEMRAQAQVRPVPAPKGVTLRQLPFEAAPYRDLFHRVGADWLWYFRLTLSDAEMAAHFSDPDVHLYTLELEGRNEALLELDFRKKGACELAYFGLTAPLIGSGAGRFLMNEAIRLAWAQPITRFHLHTCNYDSPGALGFYVRSGFTPYRREIEIDDDPRLTGLLPETAAPHVPLIRP
ncbi:MAG: GNAT family N-acetyltransferase [Sulfitobacter sp.]